MKLTKTLQTSCLCRFEMATSRLDFSWLPISSSSLSTRNSRQYDNDPNFGAMYKNE